MAPHIDVSPQKSSQHSSQRLDPPPTNIIPIGKRAGDLAIRIRQANGRLKGGNMGMRIEIRRNKFYLRGILPAKPDKSHPPKQQVISTQILANIANLPAVEQLAKRIAVQLADGSFDWDKWIRDKPKPKDLPPQTIGQWIAKLDRHYQATRADTQASRNTWDKDYDRVYRELPQHQPITADVLIQLITTTTTGSRLRIRFVNALGMLARFAGLDVDLSAYLPKGKAKQATPRELPSDEQIAQWFHRLRERDPQWSTVYGILACYGLRPSEVWHVDAASLRADPPLLRIRNGKTGSRAGILPLHPEWVEMWGLRDATMPATTTNKDPSAPISRIFRAAGIPFKPYDLRHAWAGRASAYGIDAGSAAKQMGHSVRIHEQEYGHWYTETHQRHQYERILKSSHRPIAP